MACYCLLRVLSYQSEPQKDGYNPFGAHLMFLPVGLVISAVFITFVANLKHYSYGKQKQYHRQRS